MMSAAAMLNDDDVVVVLSNAPDIMLAKRIAHILIEDGLAACVNLGAPSLSIYSWQGEIEGADEIPLTIKTTAGRQQAVIEALTRLHPYEVPEILVLPAIGGSAAYIAWVRQQTTQAGPQAPGQH